MVVSPPNHGPDTGSATLTIPCTSPTLPASSAGAYATSSTHRRQAASSSLAASPTTSSAAFIVSVPPQAPNAATLGPKILVGYQKQLNDDDPPSAQLSLPDDPEAGFSLSPSSSSSHYGIRRTRRPPSHRARSGEQRDHTFPQISTTVRPRRSQYRHSPFPPIMVANSINVILAIVPSAPPPPATAPPLTLSHKAGIDPKRIFVEQSQYLQCEEQMRTWKKMAGRTDDLSSSPVSSLPAVSTAATAVMPSPNGTAASGPATPVSASHTQPTPASSNLEMTTPASTFPNTPLSPSLKSDLSTTIDPRQDDSIPDSTTQTPSTQTRNPSLPAWSQPRAWSRIASKDTSAMSFIVPPGSSSASVAPQASSATSSEVDCPIAAGSTDQASAAAANGRMPSLTQQSKSWARQPRLSLEILLADAHTRFTAPLTVPRGLINKGNFCFANSILQVLVFCAPFYNLFTKVGDEISADFANATPLMEAVVQFLSEFGLAERRRSGRQGTSSSAIGGRELAGNFQTNEPIVPEYVYEAMKLNKRFDVMRRGHQEDAEEFLGFFLDTLHEELLSAMQRSASRIVASQKGGKAAAAARQTAGDSALLALSDGQSGAEEAERIVQRPTSPSEEGWMEVGQKGKTAFTRTTSNTESPITRMFGGKLRSVLRTPGTKDSVTLEPYQPLQLDIQPSHVHTIEDALLNLTIPETIPGVYSPARAALVDATKQVFIERTPPILVLHLKRFLYDEVGGVQKNAKEIGYGDTLDVGGEMVSPTRRGEGPTRYRLFGVVYHHGRFASGGHYTVDVLRQDDSGWIHFDDTNYGPVASEHVGRKPGHQSRGDGGHDGLAYLLFYKRQGLVVDGGLELTKESVRTSASEGASRRASSLPQSLSQTKASSRGPPSSAKVPATAPNGHARLASGGSATASMTSNANRFMAPTSIDTAGDAWSITAAKRGSGDRQGQESNTAMLPKRQEAVVATIKGKGAKT